ncbi:MAG: hypothetical protein KJ737_15945 [Proteobacteria bacterium]|nr:hypothetical protein [Pseudomonadota bacterium]
MNDLNVVNRMIDKGGRRSGYDRREFSYSGHIPERRGVPDRRCGLDRRSGQDRRETQIQKDIFIEMRSGFERRSVFAKLYKRDALSA